MLSTIEVLNLIITGIPSILVRKNIINIVEEVLNLIITGIPSILVDRAGGQSDVFLVLNLIITGIPSIQMVITDRVRKHRFCFKPYYNWNTFNTVKEFLVNAGSKCFKPYYNWNTFNTIST